MEYADITDQSEFGNIKVKIEEMRVADDRMKILLNASPIISFLFDCNFRIVDCNAAAYKFMKFESKEALLAGFVERVTTNTLRIKSDGQPSILLKEGLKTAAKDGHIKYETELQLDGKTRYLDVEMIKIPYETSFAIVANVLDMTGVRDREHELIRSREQNELQLALLNQVIKATKIGLWDMEIIKDDPINPGNVFTWSDDFRHMLGYNDINDFPDILSSWSDCIHPDDKEYILDKFEKHIMDTTGKTPYDIEYRMFKKNGECAYYRDTGETIRDENGEPLRVVGALLDVTVTKSLINEIDTQRAAAESANKAKSVFLSTMSHEIRTPMNAILGITEIQLQNEDLNPAIREAFEKIYTSGDLLLGIINDILDHSKIEAGKLELYISKYDIASLISDTAQLNMMRIGSKQLEFELDIDEHMPANLIGDELRVKQILNNLLSNAFKYTSTGIVRLSISAQPGASPDGDNIDLIIRVSDTGQGMTKEQISKLFDEYEQFNQERNRTKEGTGLGMSITRSLLRIMNGEIFVESELGIGSTFTVRLPQGRSDSTILGREMVDNLRLFRTRSRAHMKRVQISRDPMPYGKVLIVDDVDTNIYVAKGLMAPYELIIDSADSGFAAIEKVKRGMLYDIIFMDHMMPRLDGIEATKIIRSMGYRAPIVALTANAVTGQADMFLANGFDDFISKPIDIRQLNLVLNKLIRDRYPLNTGNSTGLHRGGSGSYASGRSGLQATDRSGDQSADRSGSQTADRSGLQSAGGSAPLRSTQRLLHDIGGDQPGKPNDLSKILFEANPRFAEIFARDAQKSLDALEAVLKKGAPFEEEDMKTYLLHVHGMKGALANVGKMDLSAVALKLEQYARKEDTGSIITETPAFLSALRTFVKSIQ